MRSLHVVLASVLSAMVAGPGLGVTVIAATTPEANWTCEMAFAEVAAATTALADPTRLDKAVRSCASHEDWLRAAETHPEALEGADPTAHLASRCRDDTQGLQGYATCRSLGVGPNRVQPGSVSVRSGIARSALNDGIAMEIILDTSGSMLREADDVRHIDAAKDSLSRLVRDGLVPGLPLALRTFGSDGKGRKAACRSTLTGGLDPLDREVMLDVVASVAARKRTKSPIAASIVAAADDLAGRSPIVVLVTDGDENCGGDPIREIDALRESGVPITLNVVGFALEDDTLRETMTAWARAGSGRYFDATNTDELAAALTQAATAVIEVPVKIFGPGGVVVEGAAVDAGVVVLDPGIYEVMVMSDPPVVFEAVEVVSGEHLDLWLSPPR